MRMTLFSGFVAQSILRWTSLMRSSVDIDSSASADILVSYAIMIFEMKRDGRKKKMRKEKEKKKKNDDDDDE